MSNLKKKMRTLQDIQTLTGRATDQSIAPYKAYMRISCLELEKFRKGKERTNAAGLINRIDTRFQEIEAEKTALLKTLNQAPGKKPESPLPQGAEGFKIMY